MGRRPYGAPCTGPEDRLSTGETGIATSPVPRPPGTIEAGAAYQGQGGANAPLPAQGAADATGTNHAQPVHKPCTNHMHDCQRRRLTAAPGRDTCPGFHQDRVGAVRLLRAPTPAFAHYRRSGPTPHRSTAPRPRPIWGGCVGG